MEPNILEIIKKIRNIEIDPPVRLKYNILNKIKNKRDKNLSFLAFKILKYTFQSFVYLVFMFSLYTTFLYYSKPKNVEVTFVLYRPDAKTVELAGDFNNWDFSKHKLDNKNGYWITNVKLSPGVYRYTFVVDKKEWVLDPINEEYVDSDFGGKNSIIEINKEA